MYGRGLYATYIIRYVYNWSRFLSDLPKCHAQVIFLVVFGVESYRFKGLIELTFLVSRYVFRFQTNYLNNFFLKTNVRL